VNDRNRRAVAFALASALLLSAGCSAMRMNPMFRRAIDAGDTAPETSESEQQGSTAPVPSADDSSSGPVDEMSVNGDTITVADILDPIRDDLEQHAKSMPPARYRNYLVEAIQYRVQLLARDRLIYQEASKDLSDAESEGLGKFVEQRIRDQINTEFAGRRIKYEQSLAAHGITPEKNRELVRRELVINRWLQLKIRPKIADPTRVQLWHIYESQRDSLAKPERRKMQLIEISVAAQLPRGQRSPSALQLADAQDKARRIVSEAYDALVAGADFGEVARQYSNGLRAASGGSWGWVTRGSVRERLEPAVEMLYSLESVGSLGDIVETPDAFFIVRVAQIDPGETPDFESMQPRLVEHFRNMQYNKLVEEFITKLRSKSRVRPTDITRFLRSVAAAAPQPQAVAQRQSR